MGSDITTAQVRFLTRSQGGRSSPVNDRYVVQFALNDTTGEEKGVHDCLLRFDVGDPALKRRRGTLWLPLGHRALVTMIFFRPDVVRQHLSVGARFRLFEGPQVVAKGSIVSP